MNNIIELIKENFPQYYIGGGGEIICLYLKTNQIKNKPINNIINDIINNRFTLIYNPYSSKPPSIYIDYIKIKFSNIITYDRENVDNFIFIEYGSKLVEFDSQLIKSLINEKTSYRAS